MTMGKGTCRTYLNPPLSKPTAAAVAAGSEAAAAPVWELNYDEANNTHFYYNRITNSSSWERPADYDGPDDYLDAPAGHDSASDN